jgi:PPM family protein phosphatase
MKKMRSHNTSSRQAQVASPDLLIRSFGLTDPGRKRQTNEDQFLIAELTKTMHIVQTSLSSPSAIHGEQRGHLFLVADGMGGHNAGEEASRLAVASIEEFTVDALKWFLQRDDPTAESAAAEFTAAVQEADRVVIDEAEHNTALHGMGTTLTLGYVVNSQLSVIHVGDSRAYLYRHGALTQLTKDHSVVAELVRAGAIRPDEATRHPLRHVITNVVGGTAPGVRAESHTIDLQSQDDLLLCSDGLTDMVSADEIGAVLAGAATPEAACRRLVDLANDHGGHDNITVILAQFRSAESLTPAASAQLDEV